MNVRARYLGFAACVGAGIALLVYRFAVMGLVWDAPAKNVLQIAAPVVIVIGSQLLRPIAKKQFPVLLMIVAAAAGGGIAFGICYAALPGLDRTELTRRELPGFAIDLPSGKTEDNLGYGHGQVEISAVGGTNSLAEVMWEPGKLFSADGMTSLWRVLAKTYSATTAGVAVPGIGPNGAKTMSLQLQIPNGQLYVTAIGCGARRVTVLSGGGAAMAKLLQRMVASFACHPDAAKDSALSALPWTVALPDGWYQRRIGAGQVQLTDGSNEIFLRSVAKMPERATLPKMMEAALGGHGESITVGAWSGDRFPLQGTFDGAARVGWIVPIDCHGQALLLLGFLHEQADADALAQLVKDKGRCLAPGEAAPPWPAKPQP